MPPFSFPAAAIALCIALTACAVVMQGCAPARSTQGDSRNGTIRTDTIVRISNLGAVVNTEFDEYAPSITANGRTLYFTSSRPVAPGRTDDNFWSSSADEAFWSAPRELGAPVNTGRSEGTPSIAGDGQTLYFSACDRERSGCDIYSSTLEGNAWNAPVRLPAPVNSDAWESQPSISADGRTLYFASDREGGQGGLDLWMSRSNGAGGWSLPVNLGAPVNTSGDEVSPFIAADGRTLYFSSSGLPGLGGTDMFVTRLDDDSGWSVPVNFGRPLNSEGNDEFCTLTAEGSAIFFASRREGGHGGLDLYRAEPNPFPPGGVVMLSGTVRDRRTLAPLRAALRITDASGMTAESVQHSNARSGEYVALLAAGRKYTVTATAGGYAASAVEVDARTASVYTARTHHFLLRTEGDTVRLTAALSCDVLGDAFSLLHARGDAPGLTIEELRTVETIPLLPYVFFDEGSARIPGRYSLLRDTTAFDPAALPAGTLERYHAILAIIGSRMRAHPGARLVLAGCTDESEGIADPKLGNRRAEAVAGHLREAWGVGASRIRAEGRSLPEHPSPAAVDDGRSENRRVECSTDDPAILDPLEIRRVARVRKPQQVVFTPAVTADAGVRSWRLAIRDGRRTIFSREGGNAVPDTIVWDWLDPRGAPPDPGDSLTCEFSVTASDGLEAEAQPLHIPVRLVTLERKAAEKLPDRTVETVSLILFDFDRADVEGRNARMLETVAPRITSRSTVLIRGFTDAFGDEEYNRHLSERRAVAVRNALARLVPAMAVRTEGLGESVLPYPNMLPEGRLYCRTVQIVIETPD